MLTSMKSLFHGGQRLGKRLQVAVAHYSIRATHCRYGRVQTPSKRMVPEVASPIMKTNGRST